MPPEDASAGGSELGATPSDAPEPKSASSTKKVTIRKSVAERIRLLNSSGELKQELRLTAVALHLSRLEEQAALDVLDALLEVSDDVEDTNAFVAKRAKKLAREQALAAEEAAWADQKEEGTDQKAEGEAWPEQEGAQGEGKEWPEGDAGDAAETGEEAQPQKKAKKGGARTASPLPEKSAGGEAAEVVVKRAVKLLNKGGTLKENLDFKRIADLVPMLGVEEFLRVLELLESRAESINAPTPWVRREALRRAGRIMMQVDLLNRGSPGKMDLLAPIDMEKVKEPLSLVSESVGLQILKELDKKVMEIEDPTSWIIAEATRRLPKGLVAQRLRQLNDGGMLVMPIRTAFVLEALSGVDEKTALWILQDLERRAAQIHNPTGWISAAVGRHHLQQTAVQERRAGAAAPKAAEPAAAAAKRPPAVAEDGAGAPAAKRLRAAAAGQGPPDAEAAEDAVAEGSGDEEQEEWPCDAADLEDLDGVC